MNVYVKKMRHVMSAYNDLLEVRNRKIAQNNETYSPATAKVQNEELYNLKAQDYEDARNEIESLFDSVKDLLCKASYPVTSELTADADILSNPFLTLTDTEVKAMVDKYQKEANFTMLRALSSWCDKNGKNDIQIYMPSDIVLSYQKLAKAALFTIDGINSERKAHFIPVEIDSFGDSISSKHEIEMIGDGGELQKYESKKVPDMILHSFDSVTL